MKKKLKIFAPLILLGVSASSYGCHANNGLPRLNRETYTDKISTASGFAITADSVRDNQIKENVVQLFDKGTISANIDIKLAFDRLYFTQTGFDIPPFPIDLNNFDWSFLNQITVSWSLSDQYLKISDKNYGIRYIKFADNKWWECLESNKTRKDISSMITEKYLDFRNLVFDYITKSLSVSLPIINEAEENYVYGMDISGFVGISKTDVNPPWLTANYLSPMSLLTYQLSDAINISNCIDLLNVVVSLLGEEMRFDSTMDPYKNAFCEEIGTNTIDLLDIQNIFDSSYVQLFLDYLLYEGYIINLSNLKGITDFDFFINYKNNFIYQEEVLFNLKNAFMNLYVSRTKPKLSATFQNERAPSYFTVDSEIKNMNIEFFMNQEVTDTCEVDQVNLEEYTPN